MAGTLYDHMEFPVYQYREYPKFVGNDRVSGIAHGAGTIVDSKEAEEAYFASLKAKPKNKDD